MPIRGLESGKRAALLISEMQNGITNRAFTDTPLVQQVTERSIVSKINQLAEAFRTHNLPVIHCTITARPGFQGWAVNCMLAALIAKRGDLIQGSEFGAIHDDIVVVRSDILSERHHGMAAFTGTDLNATLRAARIETVVFCGVSTNVALMGGSVEAVGHGYSVVIAEDCTAGATAETHEMQITMHLPLIATISSGADIIAALA
jgi:nicotinamidase-related amidase